MSGVPSKHQWDFDLRSSKNMIIDDKSKLIRMYVNRGLKTILEMFEYKDLPDTITQRTLELFILGGSAKLFHFKDKWYCGVGELGGVFTSDFLPSISVLTNVGLKGFEGKEFKILSKELANNPEELTKINKDDYCVVIPNDDLYNGIYDDLYHYAEIQTETDITLKFGLYNSRIPSIAVTNDDETQTSFKKFYGDIIEGKITDGVMGSALYESLKSVPYNNVHVNQLKEVIEVKQYNKATFDQTYGINNNSNSKRESLNDGEVEAYEDQLLPMVDEMLRNRKNGIDLFNKISGLNVSVELSSLWANRREKIKQELNVKEVDQDDGGSKETDPNNNGSDDNRGISSTSNQQNV